MLLCGNDAFRHGAMAIDLYTSGMPLRGTSAGSLVAFMISCRCSTKQMQVAALQWRALQNTSLGGRYRQECETFVQALLLALLDPRAQFSSASADLEVICYDCISEAPALFSKRTTPLARLDNVLCGAVSNPYLTPPGPLCDVEALLPIRVLELGLQPRSLLVLQGNLNPWSWAPALHPTLRTLYEVLTFSDRLFERFCHSQTPCARMSGTAGTALSGLLVTICLHRNHGGIL
jgi:hypothetical protein